MANTEGLRRKATTTKPGEQSVGELDTRYHRRNATSLPAADNLYDIGSLTFRHANVYSVWFRGVATTAQYADLAEMYKSDCTLEAGDVVILGGHEEITKCAEEFSTQVFGVVSAAPGFILNSELNSSEDYAIAMVGRTPVKVEGKVKKGSRLVSSNTPGYAKAVADGDSHNLGYSPLIIIGRSLEDKETDDLGVVEAVLGKL
jgi:hypothetical protein